VANELAAAAEDGTGAVIDREAQFVCDKAERSAALARIEEPVRRSLATWTRDGFAQAIELRLANGSGTYALRF
jgi:hypothetical protein